MYEMTEEPLIKRKLLLDGDGTGDDKRSQMLIKKVTKWVYSDESPSECQASYNRLLALVDSLQLNRKKFDLSYRCNVKQVAKFKMIESTFQARTNLIQKDLEKHQNLLKRAKVVKKNHVEYDLLVQTVNQQPSRVELNEKINNLKNEVNKLEKEKEILGRKFNSKVKQCYVLSTSANTLRNILKEENPNWANSSTNSEVSELDLQVTVD